MFGPTKLSYELSNINSTNSSRKIRRRPCSCCVWKTVPSPFTQILQPPNRCSRWKQLQLGIPCWGATPKQAHTRKNNLAGAGDGNTISVQINYIYTCTRFFDITHDMGDTFFCVTGSPRLTLTLTQKPRLRISEPASGSMMLHIYSRWTNHTLRMPSEGRCASRDEGVSCGARISWQHRFVAMMHLSGLTYLCEYSRAEECGKSRFKISYRGKKKSPNSSCFDHGSTDYQPLLFCSGAIVSFT